MPLLAKKKTKTTLSFPVFCVVFYLFLFVFSVASALHLQLMVLALLQWLTRRDGVRVVCRANLLTGHWKVYIAVEEVVQEFGGGVAEVEEGFTVSFSVLPCWCALL